MQSSVTAVVAACLCASAAAIALRRGDISREAARAPAPAPVAAASPAPAVPKVETTKLELTLNDVNYNKLTMTETGAHKMSSTYDEIKKAACDVVEAAVTDVAKQFATGTPAAGSLAGTLPASPAPAAALLQSEVSQGPAAAAEGPKGGPASVITNMPLPAAPKVDVNCQLNPNADGTTNFQALITDPDAKNFLLHVDPTSNSTLERAICAKIHHESGILAGCSEVQITTEKVPEWSHGICEPHLAKMVRRFSAAYTPVQVPMALHNACSLFMASISFSHDSVINAADTKKCQIATQKIKKTWKHGSGTDFLEAICHDICEQKFGNHAPQCHVTRGDAHGLAAGPAAAAVAAPA